MPSRYSIKDLERISGIKAHTLRIWEQRYGILRPERTSTNIRYYSNADMKRILNISLLNNNGYKISNITRLNDERLIQEVEKYLGNFKNESDQVENLVLCLMDLNEERFEKTINNSIAHFGFENTMEKVVFPFLKHLGDLWQVGIVSAAQEHYVSNLIRQKLIVGIDKTNTAPNKQAKTYLFFLPAGELHEMGLLYAHYLCRTKGHSCVYLGQSVPFDDLGAIAEKVNPDCLVTIITGPLQGIEINAFLNDCCKHMPKSSFLISGRLFFQGDNKPLLPSAGFRLFEDFSAFKKLI